MAELTGKVTVGVGLITSQVVEQEEEMHENMESQEERKEFVTSPVQQQQAKES